MKCVMKDFDSLFLDTCIFIYFIEKYPEYNEKIAEILEYYLNKNTIFSTSVITHSEFCTMPYRTNNHLNIQQFELLLSQLDIIPIEINRKIADDAAKLRAKYGSLRLMDALQISTAINQNCDAFLTNDKKLQRIMEIQISIV